MYSIRFRRVGKFWSLGDICSCCCDFAELYKCSFQIKYDSDKADFGCFMLQDADPEVVRSFKEYMSGFVKLID